MNSYYTCECHCDNSNVLIDNILIKGSEIHDYKTKISEF